MSWPISASSSLPFPRRQRIQPRSRSRFVSSTSSSCWSSSESSTPARAPSSTPCSDPDPRGRRHPDDIAHPPDSLRSVDDHGAAGVRPPPGDGASRFPQGHPHRRHARNECDPPGARAADNRVRTASGLRPVHHLCRSPVYRDGTRILEAIRAWGKKIVIVVNKVDIFERDDELEQVLAFVGAAAYDALGARPPICFR